MGFLEHLINRGMTNKYTDTVWNTASHAPHITYALCCGEVHVLTSKDQCYKCTKYLKWEHRIASIAEAAIKIYQDKYHREECLKLFKNVIPKNDINLIVQWCSYIKNPNFVCDADVISFMKNTPIVKNNPYLVIDSFIADLGSMQDSRYVVSRIQNCIEKLRYKMKQSVL